MLRREIVSCLLSLAVTSGDTPVSHPSAALPLPRYGSWRPYCDPHPVLQSASGRSVRQCLLPPLPGSVATALSSLRLLSVSAGRSRFRPSCEVSAVPAALDTQTIPLNAMISKHISDLGLICEIIN